MENEYALPEACRQPNMPNAENCSLKELDIAAGAAVSLRSHVRMMAIKALLVDISHDQIAKLYDTTWRNLCQRIDRFNTSGIDGLVQKPRSGRPRKIAPEKRTKYIELVQHPGRANETHWTGKKFHGYFTKKLDEERNIPSIRSIQSKSEAVKPKPQCDEAGIRAVIDTGTMRQE